MKGFDRMNKATKATLIMITALAGTLAACGSATESIDTPAAPATTAAPTTVPVTATASTTTPAPATTAAPTTTEARTTTEAPTTEAPTTEAPTPEAPTTEAPTIAPAVSYTVLRVIDGDTVDVRASDGNEFTVRLIGVDAPDDGTCEGPLTTKTMTNLVDGKTVVLTDGGDGEDIDKYGRSLRYVDVEGTDAGLTMINMGLAKARYDSRDGYGRHDREAEYVAADKASKDYGCPPPPTAAPVTVAPAPKPNTPKPPAPKPTQPPTPNRCDPNYSGCVPIDSDVDCAGGSGNGPSYVAGPVRVIGSDIYGLDRDGDGIACE